MSQQNQLFIGNLAFSVDENGLKESFEKFGNITDVKIPTDRETGRKRGFAFITFDSAESAKEALTMDGQEISGRAVRVNLAQGKKEGGQRRAR